MLPRLRQAVHTRRWLRPVRFAARAYRYVALLGLTSGLSCVAAELLGRDGLVQADDATVGRFWLRLGSTDVSVAAKILLEREYDLPLREPPSVVVDAGAYTGISTLWFAAQYPEARIVALEPDPANFALLERNVEEVPRVQALREALWADDEPVYLWASDGGAWGTQVRPTGGDDRRVPGVAPGTLMRRLGLPGVDLLKLDVEGAELELFARDVDAWLPAVRAIAVEIHEDLRPGARAAILAACSGFRPRELGHETLFLERAG